MLKLWLIGNRTSCRPIRSVIILVIKQIGLSLRGRPILLITRMITDRIGLHSVLLPLLIGAKKGFVNDWYIHRKSKAYKAPNKTMTNYAINLIWFTYDAVNHTQKKKLAKQRETASVEKIYCWRHPLFMGQFCLFL